jgi:hypothetical protein
MDLGFADAVNLSALSGTVRRKHVAGFEGRNLKDALRLVEEYGVDYRSPFNFTALMLAAEAGNVELARALVARGADPELADNHGRNALHLALARASEDPGYARDALPGLWSLLAPPSLSLRLDEQLVKIDSHRAEYVLFQLMYALLRAYLCPGSGWSSEGMRSGELLAAAERLPSSALRSDRRRRTYLSGVLARSEVASDYPYNRRLFVRLSHGRYVLNPALELRQGEAFVPVYEAMGFHFMASLRMDRYSAAVETRARAAEVARERRATKGLDP